MHDLLDPSDASRRAVIERAILIWLDAKANRSQSHATATIYRTTLSAFRTALQGAGLDLDADPQLVALAAQGWAGRPALAGGTIAPATFNKRLAILSSFYCFARTRGLLNAENPIALIERRSVQPYAGALPLDAAQIKERLRAIDRTDLAGQRDYALLAIYVQTGRRLSEVTALGWDDLRIADEYITLHIRRTKGGNVMSDTLPLGLSRALLAWLAAFYGADAPTLAPTAPIWVSLSRNSYGHRLSIRSVATICAHRLGVSKVHALRHTFAHEMEDAGAKVSEIQSRLGHRSLATTGRYLAALRRSENIYADELARRFGLDE
jgi:integrase